MNGEFSFRNVSQVITASECVFRDMHKELNLGEVTHIRQSHLNKRTVPKEKLAEWLETVCHILDSFSIPFLKNAMSNMDSIKKRVDHLQEENINGQKEKIQLKDKIIEKKSNELNEVTSTVRTEIKSFSTIAKKNCPATFTKKTIEAAVKSACDKDDRSTLSSTVLRRAAMKCSEIKLRTFYRKSMRSQWLETVSKLGFNVLETSVPILLNFP
ncbi:hypothetical protein ACHWQZ_G005671 [Mnemiopsis leidyi]